MTVPANDRVEVRFPVSAARAGTARFQIAGVSGKWADAAEIELPVWTPATSEAFATYGEIDEGALVGTDGPYHNVVKIRPPMAFSEDNADRLVEVFDRILAESLRV